MEEIYKKILQNKIIYYSPVLIIGLLVNWFCFMTRTSFDGNYIDGFNALFSHPDLLLKAFPFSIHNDDLIASLCGSGIILLFQLHIKSNRKNFKKNPHGLARWGTPEDIKPFIDPVFRRNIILSATERLRTGSHPTDWKYNRNLNSLIIGGSGSGKTTSIAEPMIMQMNSSFVITDPKGTILNRLGKMLLKKNFKIKILNLVEFENSMKYNPMVYMNKTEDILKLIETFILNTSSKQSIGDDFWPKAERLLDQALIAAVHLDFAESEKNIPMIAELLSMMETRDNDPSFKNPIDQWFDDLQKKHDDLKKQKNKTPEEKKYMRDLHYAIKQYRSFKTAAAKTAMNILITAASRLSLFNIPEVQDLMSKDELELDKIGYEKTALFVITSDKDKTYNFIASIMYTQLFNLLCTQADKNGGALKVPVHFVLDEFANIMIPDWEILISTIRSRRMSAAMFVQSKSQLVSKYKEDAKTIIGNCDTHVFLGGNDEDTMKDLVESLGKETIDDLNTSSSRGSSNESRSVNYSKLGKDLMSRFEVKTMPRDKCVVQISGIPPFFSDKYNIKNHPAYPMRASGIDDPKWFNVEKYLKWKDKAPISMKHFKKKAPVVEKIKETIAPLEVKYEGDEAYVEMMTGGFSA